MNAPAASERTILLQGTSPRAAVHAWRGACLASLARAETIVSNALIALRPADAGMGDFHFIGKRFGEVEKQLTKLGRADAAAEVRAYGKWHELRRYLCHGEMTVQGRADGAWLAVFTMTRVTGLRPERTTRLVTADTAAAELTALQAATNRLVAALRGHATALIPLARS